MAAVAASIAMLAGSAAVVPFLIARMPADFFVRSRSEAHTRRGWKWLVLSILKNGVGLVLVLIGILLLLLPGQGILTILAGLLLLNFPGKRRLELWVIRQPAIRRSVEWIRRRSGKLPLIIPEGEQPQSDSPSGE